jgi:predicted porin
MKKILYGCFVSAVFAGAAHAADLTTTKAPEAAPSAPSCFSSFWDYMNSSLKDCPLSYGPFTLYGNLDGGYGYEQWGVPLGLNADKPNYAIQKNSGNTHWLWSPNATSTSTIGIKFAQKIGGGWEIIGVADTGFNPYTLRLVNGPQSLADNNLNKLAYQTSNFDSSRAGQWDNGQGFFGISNPTYGTLTFGRTNSLLQNALGAYDPVASTAFSQIGFSSSYATFGASETARVNTALTYRLTYQNFRMAAQAQVGGYELDNAATSQYQFQLGGDYGKFSIDAIGGWANNAMSLSSYSGGTLPAGYNPDSIVKATLHNNAGIAILARYQWEKFKFYWGYIYANTSNPSNTYFPYGMSTIADGIIVPAGAVTTNTYNIARVQNTVWTGLRYEIIKNVDLQTGVYWETQNDYLQTPSYCTGSGVNTSSSKCAGGRYSYSLLFDYKPTPRIDLYAGAMVSTVYGGSASGYQHPESVDPTVGIRFRF